MVSIPTGTKKSAKKLGTPIYFTFIYEGIIENMEEFFELDDEVLPGFESEAEGKRKWTEERLAEFIEQHAAGYGSVGCWLGEYELVELESGTLRISLTPHGTQSEI
jgi:hypothetical protein